MNDIASYKEFALKLAVAASQEISPHFRKLDKIENKSDDSPVTLADKNAERVMREMIAEAYPEHGIIGEEFGNENEDADYVWVLDPIDGTLNFITGQPLFMTLVALLYQGNPVLGVAHQPILNETWLGMNGEQTLFNNESLFSKKDIMLKDACIATTSPYLFNSREKACFEAVRDAAARDCYGSDSYAYTMLASGHIDIVCEAGLSAYDVMALVPIIEGAGGVVTDWAGNPLRLQNMTNIDVVASANQSLHDEVLQVIEGE